MTYCNNIIFGILNIFSEFLRAKPAECNYTLIINKNIDISLAIDIKLSIFENIKLCSKPKFDFHIKEERCTSYRKIWQLKYLVSTWKSAGSILLPFDKIYNSVMIFLEIFYKSVFQSETVAVCGIEPLCKQWLFKSILYFGKTKHSKALDIGIDILYK